MFLIPPDSRLSATCNWSQPSIGVENKSAINLHCERLSFHTPPTPEHFWSVTPHRWCRQTQKNCACCKKNKGGTATRPTHTGGVRTCCLFRDELEPGWRDCSHNQGQLQRQSFAFNSEAPCVHAWCLAPRPYLAIPRKRTPSAEVSAPSARISSALTDGKNDSRLQDFWHVREGWFFLYIYWHVKRP